MHLCLRQAPAVIHPAVQHRATCALSAGCKDHRLHRHRACAAPAPGHHFHRRQLLKRTSLLLCASWWPFRHMSSSDAFQLSGDRWWRPDTVAIVTGGTLQADHSALTSFLIVMTFLTQTSANLCCLSAANKGIGYGIAKLLAEQGLTTVVACRNGKSQTKRNV